MNRIKALRALTAIDAYKIDHRRQYPDKTEHVLSNWTARSSRVPGVDQVIFFGLQAFIKDFIEVAFDDFFSFPRDIAVEAYVKRITEVIGPNSIGGDHISELHDLQYVPLRFKALPEGTLVPLRVPMFTVENTHPDFFWLVNYIESVLSASIWLPCTSATTAWNIRKMLDEWAEKTSSTPEFVEWQGHDFSFRGMEGLAGSAMSGAGHLLAFTGSDTLPALDYVDTFYPGDNGLVGGSVAATEHSVMSAGGDLSEMETFSRLLDLYPEGIVSVVSDTWDLWKVLTEYLPALKEKIMARNGKLVIRPDSGDPVDIICGDEWEVKSDGGDHPSSKGVAELLWEVFGGTVNDKGFKELDPHIGMIYGDSINYDRAEMMCARLADKGFASTNIVLGIGSYNYQYVTRDTFGFAMKATWAQIDGQGYDLYKDPVTDHSGKKSARGRLSVVMGEERLHLLNQATPEEEERSLLKTVWEDGNFIHEWSFADVRKTLREQ
jgi:nicotinamide phosphoribosyltransferase